MHPSLPAALERQAAADPESPFLFWPEGWNWRWWSWRQVAELAAQWSAPLAGLRAGAGVAFAGDSYPQAIVLDLAVQAAGLTPVPLAGGEGAAAEAGCVAWLEETAGEARVTRLDGEVALWDAAGGGPAVLLAGEGGDWRPLPVAELLAAAARVEGTIGAASRVEGATGSAAGPRGSRGREILVGGWPLREWAGRLLAAWAVTAGAALVLETDPSRRLGTVLWARPTVFHGGAAETAALRLQVEAARRPHRWRGWRRLPSPPLGRLRTLFQLQPPAPAEAAFWQERGARLLQLPGPGDAGPIPSGAARPVRPGMV
ncbi:MAG TPA: AMP-binding protein [Thermoanaerobaculia bacterium]|nr:AMP-binding protein [Thermoanaerobaculia bacterium]